MSVQRADAIVEHDGGFREQVSLSSEISRSEASLNWTAGSKRQVRSRRRRSGSGASCELGAARA